MRSIHDVLKEIEDSVKNLPQSYLNTDRLSGLVQEAKHIAHQVAAKVDDAAKAVEAEAPKVEAEVETVAHEIETEAEKAEAATEPSPEPNPEPIPEAPTPPAETVQ